MFKKSEKEPLYRPYFKLLRDYANYVEVKSRRTGDIWKLMVKGGFIVTYHMPRGQQAYHFQERSATIASAVKKIYRHDAYVMRFRYAKQK